jgi:hypothetical protein
MRVDRREAKRYCINIQYDSGVKVDNADGRVEAESGRSAPPLRLLDALCERLRYMHYSLRTEEAYVHWVRGFVRWSGRRHPGEMARRRHDHDLHPHAEVRRRRNGEPLDSLTMTATLTATPADDDTGESLPPPPPPRARKPFIPCYRATPSFTAVATSAS